MLGNIQHHNQETFDDRNQRKGSFLSKEIRLRNFNEMRPARTTGFVISERSLHAGFYEGIYLVLIAGGGHVSASLVLKLPFENCYCSLLGKMKDK